MNRADNRKALIQLTGATRVVGEAFQLSRALHMAYRQHNSGCLLTSLIVGGAGASDGEGACDSAGAGNIGAEAGAGAVAAAGFGPATGVAAVGGFFFGKGFFFSPSFFFIGFFTGFDGGGAGVSSTVTGFGRICCAKPVVVVGSMLSVAGW